MAAQTPEPLTPLQLLVAKHYCQGEFAYVTDYKQVVNVGDTLFHFAISEAGDMSGPYDMRAALYRAVDELRYLSACLENES